MDLVRFEEKTYPKEFFFQIINSIADFVQVVNKKNQVIYRNDTMKEVLKEAKKQGTVLTDFSATQRTLETGEVIQQEQTYLGESYSVKTSPLWNKEGDLVGAVEVFRSNSREKKLHEELVEKNQSMVHEMVLASSVQKALLPRKGFLKTVKVGYYFEPLDYISGDLFDVFSLDDRHIAFYMSDTVGHGFASGMVTMFIHQAMRTLEKEILLHPSLTLEKIGKKFRNLKLNLDYYFTMFYGVYDLEGQVLSYANAGHNCPPILKGRNLCMPLEITGRPIMGYAYEDFYESHQIPVYPGDQLLLCTDGFIESSNEHKEYYGFPRLLQLMETISGDLIDCLVQDQNQFTWGPLTDDRTALSLEMY